MSIQDTVGIAGHSQSADADARLRVSALIDSELDEDGIDAAIDALLASESLTRFWLDAHRAGDWLRSDEVVCIADDAFALRRFSAALAEEPAILAPRTLRRSRSSSFWMRTGLPGASIAAALAAVAWVASPFWLGDDSKKNLASSSAASSDVPALVIATANPAPQAELRPAIDPDRLSPYLAAHRDVTPFAYRGASARPAAFNTPAPASALSAPQ